MSAIQVPRRFSCAVAAVLVLSGASGALGADRFITPEGAGTKDGLTWENAGLGTQASFQAAWDALAPGDTLHVGGGVYGSVGIKARSGGQPDKPIRLIGEDRGSGLPRFTSDFDKFRGGATFFAAADGVSWVEISGFRLTAYQRGVFLRGKGSHLALSHLTIEGALEGIRCDGGADPGKPDLGTHDVTVADCRFDKFVKRAIRLQGGNYRWRIERCYADAGGKEWGVAPFPICYQLSARPKDPQYAKSGEDAKAIAPSVKEATTEGAATDDGEAAGAGEYGVHSSGQIYAMEHDIELIDCVAVNCYYEGTGKKSRYWNGDGFCGERGAKNFRFVRCVSMHHTDGGWDMKSDNLEFIDCVGIDNKDNFRLWSGTPKLTNCVSAFAYKRGGVGATSGLWTQTSVELGTCTFVDNPVVIDSPNAVVTFRDSIYTGKLPEGKSVVLERCFVGSAGEARIAAGRGFEWTAPGPEFDSAAFPGQGFSSARWSR